MKSILISIKPKWCAKIMNGEKTIEVRKNKGLYKAIQTLISMYGYAEFYGYCTKDSHQLVKPKNYNKYLLFTKGAVDYSRERTLNGKVIFKFRCYKAEKYVNGCKLDGDYSDYEYILKPSCLTEEELENYCEDLSFYALYISDLEIFDKPKELNEFKKCQLLWNCEPHDCKTCRHSLSLTKAPQSWCYVEVLL